MSDTKKVAQLPPTKTTLSPLHEAIFQGWAKAHGVHDEANDPEHAFDHRGHFQATNGMIHPTGAIEHMGIAAELAARKPSNDPLTNLRQHVADMNDFQKKKAVFEAQNHPLALAHHKEQAFQEAEKHVGHTIPRTLDISTENKAK